MRNPSHTELLKFVEPIAPLDTYLGLCTESYDLSKPHPPQDAYDFYREYVKAAKGAILEPMCGTGRFLIPLLEEGFFIEGFDASPHMLTKLDEKAKQKNLKPQVWHGFAHDFKKPKKYELIFIPSGSFCLMTEKNEVLAALQAFYEHLSDSGVLVFEIETVNSVPSVGIWRDSMWHKPDGTAILSSFLATLEQGICTTYGKYELVSGNQIVRAEIETYKIRIYEEEIFKNMLQSVGFHQIRLIKAFDTHEKPGPLDESIVYECRK